MKALILSMFFTVSVSAFANYELQSAAPTASDELTNFVLVGDVAKTATEINVTNLKLTFDSTVRGSVAQDVLVKSWSYTGVVDSVCREFGARSRKGETLSPYENRDYVLVTNIDSTNKLEFNFEVPLNEYAILTQVVCKR